MRVELVSLAESSRNENKLGNCQRSIPQRRPYLHLVPFVQERLSPAMGVRISGIDVSKSSSDLVGTLRESLHKHTVVAISDQDLEDESLQEFGLAWGELLTHPASEKKPNPHIQVLASQTGARGRGLGAWHSDMSWHPTPPWITMLYGRTIPRFGGGTGYANQRLAFEMLDLATKDKRRSHRRQLPTIAEIEDLSANHTGKGFGPQVPDSVHPVIRTHDATQDRALYVNPEFTTHIVDMSDSDSQRILWSLWLHSTCEEFVYRHCWQTGDLVIWDNRSVMHTAILDYDEPRYMTRVVVKGDAPH